MSADDMDVPDSTSGPDDAGRPASSAWPPGMWKIWLSLVLFTISMAVLFGQVIYAVLTR